LRDIKTSINKGEIEDRTINFVNRQLNPFGLFFRGAQCTAIYGIIGERDKLEDDEMFGKKYFDVEPAPIRRAVEAQYKE
jgi:hypothetical protein